MVAEIGEPGAVRRVAEKLGVSPDAVRFWIKNAPAELGGKTGLTSDQLEELKALRRENAEVRRTSEILKAARVVSKGRANDRCKPLSGSPVRKGLARSAVQPSGDGVEVDLVVG